MTELATKFLDQVWSKQPTGTFFMASKNWDTGEWRDIACGKPHQGLLKTSGVNDLYFAPCSFTDNRRLRRNANGGRWLYADLDEVHPDHLQSRVQPTLSWETSRSRFQAMWLLDRSVSTRTLERLNRQLTYYTGADKGGWSLTKVLRVPGTVSTKYGKDQPWTVRLHSIKKVVHHVEDLSTLLRDVDTEGHEDTPDRPSISQLPSYDDVWKARRRRMSVRARQLLNTDTVLASDDRSARLWELEHELIKTNIPLSEILVLVRESPWNKYSGQRREVDMLWREINKVNSNRAHVPAEKLVRRQLKPIQKTKTARKKPVPRKALATVSYRDLMTRPLPRANWLVEGIWSEGAHGLLGGESKSFKTLLTLDLAVSVASGTPFLNRFPVPKQGPVLIVQEENNAGDIQDRLMRISSSRGIGPAVHTNKSETNGKHDTTLDFGADLPIAIANNSGFAFNHQPDMVRLERFLRKERPALCIFDPLYLLTPGLNEDSASEMTPILKDLLRLKQKYECGIMIVHHYHKRSGSKEKGHTRSAERMSGTGVFHRWLASGVYVERPDESLPTVRLSSEHRSQASPGAFAITFDLGTNEDLHYAVTVDSWLAKPVVMAADRVNEVVDEMVGERLVDIAERVGWNRDKLKARIIAQGNYRVARISNVSYVKPKKEQ